MRHSSERSGASRNARSGLENSPSGSGGWRIQLNGDSIDTDADRDPSSADDLDVLDDEHVDNEVFALSRADSAQISRESSAANDRARILSYLSSHLSFHPADLSPIVARVKHTNRISFEEGTALARSAMAEADPTIAQELFETANHRFSETLQIKPNDYRFAAFALIPLFLFSFLFAVHSTIGDFP